jgi:Holliday junction resolvase
MNIALREHEKAARIVAKELEDDGYAVLFKPSPEQIPFSLGSYIPDLLATKNNDNLIIEIKTRDKPSIDRLNRYRKVAEIIQTHPDWKFLIKTLAETTEKSKTSLAQVISLEEIHQYLDKVKKIGLISPEFAIPYLWNTIIALLRHQAVDVHIEYSELTDRSLINQLYTLGQISAEQHATLLKWDVLRNHAAHDLEFSVKPEENSAMLAFIDKLSQD